MEKIYKKLGEALKTVRELDPSDENMNKITEKCALLRSVSLMTFIIISCYLVETTRDNPFHIIFSLIANPLIMVMGWLITGGINFTKVKINQVRDRQRAVKITILHSILLTMAIISVVLEAKVLAGWEMIYGSMDDFRGDWQTVVFYLLQIFMFIGIIVMLISIYEYRFFSIEYYSVICHGVGFIYTLMVYINMIRLQNETEYQLRILLRYDWNYVEALALASAFLIYCSKIRKKYHC